MGFFGNTFSPLTSTSLSPSDQGGGDFGEGSGDFGNDPGTNTNTANVLTNASAVPSRGKAPNSAFVTGLNLLFKDPTAFFNTLTSNDASSVPNEEVKSAAEKPVSQNLPTIPTWVKVVIIGSIGIVGLALIGIVTYEVKK